MIVLTQTVYLQIEIETEWIESSGMSCQVKTAFSFSSGSCFLQKANSVGAFFFFFRRVMGSRRHVSDVAVLPITMACLLSLTFCIPPPPILALFFPWFWNRRSRLSSSCWAWFLTRLRTLGYGRCRSLIPSWRLFSGRKRCSRRLTWGTHSRFSLVRFFVSFCCKSIPGTHVLYSIEVYVRHLYKAYRAILVYSYTRYLV